tara:strand:+ start:277 stop:495 length:219 start_codon:yes stop_codon:yes gene_type:complete
MADQNSSEKIDFLVNKVIVLDRHSPGDIERHSWTVVHENKHGFVPSEYDVREIDEALYIEVLDRVRKKLASS